MTPKLNPGAANRANLRRLLEQDRQLIQIVDHSLADATERAGDHLACRPGCTQCCYGAFAITPLDALRLRTAMAELATTNPAQAAAIDVRAQRYLTEFANDFPGDPNTGILSDAPEAKEAFEDFANEAPCPALDPATGLCEVYAARPMTCRIFGPPVRSQSTSGEKETAEEGLAVCELCFTQATAEEIAAAEMQVPHEAEEQLLAQFPADQGETILAYCLISNH